MFQSSLMSLSVIVCQSVSNDTSGRLHLTSLEYAGDSTLYVGTSGGHVSAWDTRQNTCFMHWLADTDSTREIGLITFSVISMVVTSRKTRKSCVVNLYLLLQTFLLQILCTLCVNLYTFFRNSPSGNIINYVTYFGAVTFQSN